MTSLEQTSGLATYALIKIVVLPLTLVLLETRGFLYARVVILVKIGLSCTIKIAAESLVMIVMGRGLTLGLHRVAFVVFGRIFSVSWVGGLVVLVRRWV